VEKLSRILILIIFPSAVFSAVSFYGYETPAEKININGNEIIVQREVVKGGAREVMDPIYKKVIDSGYVMIGNESLTAFVKKLADDKSGAKRTGWHDMEYMETDGSKFYALAGRNMKENPGYSELISISTVKKEAPCCLNIKIMQPDGARLTDNMRSECGGIVHDFRYYSVAYPDAVMLAEFYEKQLLAEGYIFSSMKKSGRFMIQAVKGSEEMNITGNGSAGAFTVLVALKKGGTGENY